MRHHLNLGVDLSKRWGPLQLSSTNVAEGVNRKIEEAERACGGYFHSERDRDFRYGVLARELLEGRWKRVNWKYQQVAHLLRHLFKERYEKDDLQV